MASHSNLLTQWLGLLSCRRRPTDFGQFEQHPTKYRTYPVLPEYRSQKHNNLF